jgi:hypothetical protein
MPFLSVFPVVAAFSKCFFVVTKVPEGDTIFPVVNPDASCLSVSNLDVSCMPVVNLDVSCLPVVNLDVSCS